MSVSDSYKKVLTATHQRNQWGHSGAKPRHLQAVRELANRVGAKTILDYGCGEGKLSEALRDEYEFVNYDPGMPEWSTPPSGGPYDLLVCTEVLEHIEPERLDETLAEISALAGKAMYFTIPHCAAREILTDGRNAHLIIEPQEWWTNKLRKYWPTIQPKSLHFLVWGGNATPYRTQYVWLSQGVHHA